jgi:hypothetical protein
MEDADHLLFKCPMAEFMWAFVREALGGMATQIHERIALRLATG